ncbi:MAG: cytochrome c biogenesis protein CcsA [Alphaproteobacteria bacterium]|nr:cytochrome c biogenesis protein CcsA [Alphaproteobacteria bacterium]
MSPALNIAALNIAALIALAPITALALRPAPARDAVFWGGVALALAAAAAWTALRVGAGWDAGLATALWLSVAATVAAFAGVTLLAPGAARLAIFVGPYLLLAGVLASVLDRPLDAEAGGGLAAGGVSPDAWIILHVAVSLATYALATLAAMAGLAVFVKERALKSRRSGRLSRDLPSVAEAETLQFRLLLAAEAVLGAGILSGMALGWATVGRVLSFDHKTVLSLAAFVVVGVVLGLHARFGLRGKQAARGVLVVYLLLTLAYPGVKAIQTLVSG